MKHVLVTGGAGYVGSHLVEQLLAKGYQVSVLDAFYYGESGTARWKDDPKVRIVRGDICSIRDLVRAIKGVDTVIALAAIVGDPACELNHEETICSNFESTKVLVEIAKWHDVKRIVFASSCSVYGANSSCLLNEGSWLNPVSLYAKTRVLSENVLLAASDEIEVVVLRLATVYGLSARMRFDLVANILTAKAAREGEIDIQGPDQYRPMVHVRDAARAFALAAEGPTEIVNGQVFNVGCSEHNFTIREIGDMIRNVFPSVHVSIHDSVDKRDYRVDFSKVASLLGFETSCNLEAGIREMKLFLEENAMLDYKDDLYYNVKYLYRYRVAPQDPDVARAAPEA